MIIFAIGIDKTAKIIISKWFNLIIALKVQHIVVIAVILLDIMNYKQYDHISKISIFFPILYDYMIPFILA